jgi:HlyD family secretion protein
MEGKIIDKKKVAFVAVGLAVAVGVALKLFVFSNSFLYAGTIEATKVDIPARVASVISAVDVIEGQRVSEGQTLLTLACEDYKIAADLAKETFDRKERLYRQGSEPKESFDQAKNRWEDASLRMKWCNVTAPLSGTVLNKFHEVGEMVTPGIRLFTVANLRRPYAYIYVPQPLIAKIALGQRLNGYLPELRSRVFEGVVTQISDQAEFTPKNVQTREERTRLVFAIKVEFKNEDEILKPGMSIEMKLSEGGTYDDSRNRH